LTVGVYVLIDLMRDRVTLLSIGLHPFGIAWVIIPTFIVHVSLAVWSVGALCVFNLPVTLQATDDIFVCFSRVIWVEELTHIDEFLFCPRCRVRGEYCASAVITRSCLRRGAVVR
jgi:hypothetical protein